MKIVLLYISCIIIICVSCKKKELVETAPKMEKKYINDPLVYEVINAVLELPEFKKDSVDYMIDFANPLLFDLEMDGDNFYGYAEEYFGEFDKVAIENQKEALKYSYYQKGKINNITLVDYDLTNIKTDQQFDSLNQSLNKYLPYVAISFPIFNKQKNTAFMFYHHNCGFLCGYGKKLFVKKINGKWQIVLVYEEYIS